MDNEELWAKLSEHDEDNDIITAGSIGCGQNHFDSTEEGVACGHAYSILAKVELSDGTRLLKLRNPWGAEQYSGDWSDESGLWTQWAREEVGSNIANDGIFFMDLDSFKNNFNWVTVNYDTYDWHHDYFLALDDESSDVWGGHWCDDCVHRIMHVHSDVTQTFHVGAHLYEKRSYGGESTETRDCTEGPSAWVFEIDPEWPEYPSNQFNDGSKWLTDLTIEAGEDRTFHVLLDWADGFARDWSLTVWGEDASIIVYDHDENDSMHLPDIYDDERQEPAELLWGDDEPTPESESESEQE